jgi:hypothetical protein
MIVHHPLCDAVGNIQASRVIANERFKEGDPLITTKLLDR